MRKLILFLIVITAGVAGFYIYDQWPRNPVALKPDLITVAAPKIGDTVKSPLVIRGEARGYWFFEATFPVVLTNWDGLIIAQHYAQAQSEWMTTDFVPFEAKLEFESPVLPGADKNHFSRRGYLILKKDNPSGLPEYDDSLEIPVRFK
ncbi:MAG: Gmad2 immunoglobulin-like domain-containing protein [Patescibacteria group bacterium]